MSDEERKKDLRDTAELIKSGYAGVNSEGTIIDRRIEKGVPVEENPLFGTPKPKPVLIVEGDKGIELIEEALKDVKNTNGKILVVGSGFDVQVKFPNLPDHIKNQIEFVDDLKDKVNLDSIEELKARREGITNLTSTEIYPYHSNHQSYEYSDTPLRTKYRKSSNKKYVRRKKAKNGRTKKRRK